MIPLCKERIPQETCSPGLAPVQVLRQTLCYPQEIGPLLDLVSARLTAAGFTERDVFGVRLALEEAIVNALRHGHRGDPTKSVRVRCLVSPDRILAEVEDQGPGFDPEQVPDPLAPENLERPSGRGLFLMRTYMTWIRFNARGNHVTMCKCRSAA